MDHWSARLWKALNRKGWSQRELARRSGIDEQKVYKYLQGKVDQPRGDTLLRLADILGVSEIWLRSGAGPSVVNVPIIGRVSAGESFFPLDEDSTGGPSGEFQFEIDASDPIALHVGGESMLPVYRPGDFLICSRKRGSEITECLNRDCVVKTEAGEGYIKKLTADREPEVYNLLSYNTPPITGVKLLWAAPIIWVRRG
jgi:transcriptional regulator with XRE-family HTH domain